MGFLRNTLGVLLGLAAAGLIISLCMKTDASWGCTQDSIPFNHWESLLKKAAGKPSFYWMLLVSSGIGVTIGGVITAMVVKYAKVAYAILIGFIVLFIAMLDIIIFPYHPTFYKILIFITYFPFSWVGGKIVEVIYERKKKKNPTK